MHRSKPAFVGYSRLALYELYLATAEKVSDDVSQQPNTLGQIGLWHGPLYDQDEAYIVFLLRDQDNAQLEIIAIIVEAVFAVAFDAALIALTGPIAAADIVKQAATVLQDIGKEVIAQIENKREDKVLGGFSLVIRNGDGGPQFQFSPLPYTTLHGDGSGSAASFSIVGHNDQRFDLWLAAW
jgi:hypothetical protein